VGHEFRERKRPVGRPLGGGGISKSDPWWGIGDRPRGASPDLESLSEGVSRKRGGRRREGVIG